LAGTTELGLLDFNAAVKVPPSLVVNTSVGGTIRVFDWSVRPELFVDNLVNLRYVLKGAFTSGPSMGRPRTAALRVAIDSR
jgi:hypothetical protein